MRNLYVFSSQMTKLFCFKHWSRKPFSVFNSFRLVIKICSLCVTYNMLLAPEVSMAQVDTTGKMKNIDIDEVTIRDERKTALFSHTARIVSVISREEIVNAPAGSLSDILEYAVNVDIRQRGKDGVQADVCIRGGTFDQTVVLLNGINLTDPQTGHLSLNLPIDLESIERIEILEGPSSRIYGANAFSGAINIITNATKKNKLKTFVSAGENGYYQVLLSGNLVTKAFTHFLTADSKSSDGYTHNTDFDAFNLFYQGKFEHRLVKFDYQIGYTDKSYGANSFYTPKYPDQFEENKTILTSLKAETGNKIKTIASIFFRRNFDHYVLIRDNPAFYNNYHRTDISGINIRSSFKSILGNTQLGLEFRDENILSNRLGKLISTPVKISGEDSVKYTKKDSRSQMNAIIEHSVEFYKFYISAGSLFSAGSIFSFNSQPDYHFILYPGFDISYSLSSTLKIYSSINKSYRYPTFTDLYYEGPKNVGNPELLPEEAITYEGGIKFFLSDLSGNVSYFQRDGKNIIDWIWNEEQQKWHTLNLTKLSTNGFEFSASYNSINHRLYPIKSLSLSYAYIQVSKNSEDMLSKYVLDNLKHKFAFSCNHAIYSYLSASWLFGYQNRDGEFLKYNAIQKTETTSSFKPYCLTDLRIQWAKAKYSIFAEVTNIFNISYEDIGNVIQPGRIFRMGARVEL